MMSFSLPRRKSVLWGRDVLEYAQDVFLLNQHGQSQNNDKFSEESILIISPLGVKAEAWTDTVDNHLCGMGGGRQFDGRMQTSFRRRNRHGLRLSLGVWYLEKFASL